MNIPIPDKASLLNKISELTKIVKQFWEILATNIWLILQFAGLLALGILITLFLRRLVGKVTEKHLSKLHSKLLRTLTFYIGIILAFLFALSVFGLEINKIMASTGIFAGILTFAIAFASQTSISNLLSGIFLVFEKPFQIGDYISLDDTLGEVLSVDLLSINIRTKDNTFVRIPNEQLLKAKFRNVTRFPIRRCDIKLRVSFKEDLQKVKKVLLGVVEQNPNCLVSPAPEFTNIEFGDSGIELQFSVWSKQTSFSSLQTNIHMEIQAALNLHNIDLPVAVPVAG